MKKKSIFFAITMILFGLTSTAYAVENEDFGSSSDEDVYQCQTVNDYYACWTNPNNMGLHVTFTDEDGNEIGEVQLPDGTIEGDIQQNSSAWQQSMREWFDNDENACNAAIQAGVGSTCEDVKKAIEDGSLFGKVEPTYNICYSTKSASEGGKCSDNTQTQMTAKELANWLVENSSTPEAETHLRGLLNGLILPNILGNLMMTDEDIEALREAGYNVTVGSSGEFSCDSTGSNGGKKHTNCYEMLVELLSHWAEEGYGQNFLKLFEDLIPETGDGGGNNSYGFGCGLNINVCGSGVNSSFSSPGDVECILNNPMYDVGGNTFCGVSLSTNFSQITSGLQRVYAGRFVPVTGTPTVDIKANCYTPLDKKGVPKGSLGSMAITLNNGGGNVVLTFFDNSIVYTPTSSTSGGGGGGSGITSYGQKYASATFNVHYDYNNSSGISGFNTYVDKQSGQGTTNPGSQFNTNIDSSTGSVSSTNFSTMTAMASGTYKDALSIALDGLQGPFTELLSAKSGTATVSVDVEQDYCPGTCTVSFTGSDKSDVNKDAKAFKDNNGEAYNITLPDASCDSHTCYINGFSKTGITSENDCDKAKGKWQCTSYIAKATFETPTKKECDNFTNSGKTADFEPYESNKDGCNVNLSFGNKVSHSGGSELVCKLPVEVINQLSTCNSSSPNYNPKTHTCTGSTFAFDKIIYRTIDLSNPFPGKNGSGRRTGFNWSSSDVQKYILNRQDVYEKEPLYSITLTPTSIKTIRGYNDKSSYDDFNLTCDGNGHNCISRFLDNTTYVDISGRCSNMTSSNFNDCLDYTI